MVIVDAVGSPEHLRAVRHVAAKAVGRPVDPTLPVTLNFHPDRLVRRVPILASLLAAGAYQSQFVTGTSNGMLDADLGGARSRWESAMFGGAYDGAPPECRPVYGSLNHDRAAVGGAPRFGAP